ncbi:MAG: lipoprotein-releasing ABC transporter permease subunit [Rickettsiales bacterium]|jgi:lipoprotein-releasing system permease protein|nr:lipoprotein-releasing ABC transporter permease subunit [Rickettsiales bacterium]
MFLGTEFFIALRYLKAKRKEKLISVVAIFSFFGIMLGVATLIIVMSVMNGFRDDLIERVVGINAHITVIPKNDSVFQYKSMIGDLANISEIVSVNPMVEGQAMFLGEKNSGGGIVKALEFESLKTKKKIYDSIKNIDDVEDFDGGSRAFIGKKLAENLNLAEGDGLRVVSPETNSTLIGIIPKIKTYEVAGIFESGLQEYDSMVIFIPLRMGQLQFGYINSVNAIEIFLNNINNSSETNDKIRETLLKFGRDFFSVDWKEANTSLIEALNVERSVMFIILSLLILIAAFNIISSLTMLVMDKNKQIALLKTIGMDNKSIMSIFLICGSFIGFLGTLVGAATGIIFTLNINAARAFLERVFGVNLFNPSIYSLTRLPSRILLSDIFLIVSLSMALSFLSTIYPAKKAAKINPAETLRYE